jgi:hypothetical protein
MDSYFWFIYVYLWGVPKSEEKIDNRQASKNNLCVILFNHLLPLVPTYFYSSANYI